MAFVQGTLLRHAPFSNSSSSARCSRQQQMCRGACRTLLRVESAQQERAPGLERAKKAGAALLLSAGLFAGAGLPAFAELNKYEAEVGGEFGMGTAQQYGEADLKGRDFSNQDLRRSNFTSADCRNCNFKNANLQAAYFIKAVTFKANFENANLNDVLMDRAVMNEANLRNAQLQRAVFTRSDLTGADISGADFTNALVDRPMQIALCRYADGVNSVTGEDTRKSLGCGSRRRFKESSPSSPEGPQVSQDEKADFVKSMPVYRQ